MCKPPKLANNPEEGFCSGAGAGFVSGGAVVLALVLAETEERFPNKDFFSGLVSSEVRMIL